MRKPSVSVPDELLEKFDDTINQRKARKEIDNDTDRSKVIRGLMREYIEEHYQEVEEGNPNGREATAD